MQCWKKNRRVITPSLVGKQTVRDIIEAKIKQSISPPSGEAPPFIRIRNSTKTEIINAVLQ
ncbi:hypothetical protein BVI434_280019 [Burkholderia vietnamiensis]|nr:hypothetical protein BVI434_280019 [Burkholderia vietnamiensis]